MSINQNVRKLEKREHGENSLACTSSYMTPRNSKKRVRSGGAFSDNSNDELLVAMKRVQRKSSSSIIAAPFQLPLPPHNKLDEDLAASEIFERESDRIAILASMVPDEIINKHADYSVREYDVALMFVDVSGFTDLCETYTKAGRGAPSKITEVLNLNIGSIVQEILTHSGDVLKFSGDAFISMWKASERTTMQDVVHAAIDCGLLIQNNHGIEMDVGLVLKVKVAIAAGRVYFSVIGDETFGHYVLVGDPVWDCKAAERLCKAGDLITSPSAWSYVNEVEYWTTLLPDGVHKRVLGAGATWKRVEKLKVAAFRPIRKELNVSELRVDKKPPINESISSMSSTSSSPLRQFALRPSVMSALNGSWWPMLRRFMSMPVRRAVDSDEPMDCLTEVRRIVIVFLNIVCERCDEPELIKIANSAYQCVCRIVGEYSGLVNKMNLFDKDLMFLVVFGLRGSKHEAEAMRALQCAAALRERLALDTNFISVSVGVTTGTAYCGVIGHALRREYTVIGAHVNKAARLMTGYLNKVTCDKETFVNCKMDKDNFVCLPPKELKGIKNPGPIFEFVKHQVSLEDHKSSMRLPLLGRASELQMFRDLVDAALSQHDPRCAFVIFGPTMVGKTRLLEKCVEIGREYFIVLKVILKDKKKVPFGLIRKIFMNSLQDGQITQDAFEDHLKTNLNMESVSPLEVYAVNVIFNCRFPLPEKFSYYGDLLSDPRVKALLRGMYAKLFPELRMFAVEEGNYIDDYSWQVVQLMVEVKAALFLLTIPSEDILSTVGKRVLGKPSVVKVQLSGVDRWYHAALACQMLGVCAVPADFEKVIQNSSGGMPGWIQNFVWSLLQSGWLQVVSVPRDAALEAGAVLPSLLDHDESSVHTSAAAVGNSWKLFRTTYKDSLASLPIDSCSCTSMDNIKMAVLNEGIKLEDMAKDVSMDAVILKTYDSLTPFEKMLLKCGAVLGERFSRMMLQYLLQPESSRKLAIAVKKMFEAGVLACQGGDFTRDPSLVAVFPLRSPHEGSLPYCACISNHQSENCGDLPKYALCGYIKFKYSLFSTTVYDLLTEAQKLELHSRALTYLERYTRRCAGCGAASFTRLLGRRQDDGLARASRLAAMAREQIAELCEDEPYRPSQSALSLISDDEVNLYPPPIRTAVIERDSKDTDRLHLPAAAGRRRSRFQRVRSFYSFRMSTCECVAILRVVYWQLIRHCQGAEETGKMMEGYLEYAALCVSRCYYSRAIELLADAEKLFEGGDFGTELYPWQRDVVQGRIASLRGACHLGLADRTEARVQLLHAMRLYGCPFPTTKHSRRIRDLEVSMRQALILNMIPSLLVGTCSGVTGHCFEEIANTLNHLHHLFQQCHNFNEAELAAKWSLNMALKTDTNFRLLCESYANMINVARTNKSFGKCSALKRLALELCQRKRTQLDVTEVHAVASLYSSIFRYYMASGQMEASISLGLTARHLLSELAEPSVNESLIMWMLKLLLAELRVSDMVSAMQVLLPLSLPYSHSSEARSWYYYISLIIQLDTGYCVETYDACEQFYKCQEDRMSYHISKGPEADWNFSITMWLMCTRMGWWERRALWQELVAALLRHRFREESVQMMIYVKLVEGLLIDLVNEVNKHHSAPVKELEMYITRIMCDIKRNCLIMYKPRYYILKAYFAYIRDEKRKAFRVLKKSSNLSKKLGHGPVLIWCEHTLKHWLGTLEPELEHYWVQHCQPGNQLDYKLFFPETPSKIVPYTLPLPTKM